VTWKDGNEGHRETFDGKFETVLAAACKKNSAPYHCGKARAGNTIPLQTVASTLPRSQKPWARLKAKRGNCNTGVVSGVLEALFNLICNYLPPTPKRSDVRHTGWESLREMCGGEDFIGLYHFSTWFEQSHQNRPPCLSSDAESTNTRRLSAVTKFIKSLKFLTFTLSLLYRQLNPGSWAKAIQVVSEVCARHGPSKTIRSGRWDAWTGRAVLVNMSTHQHRDLGDWLDGLASISCFGSFTGGGRICRS